MDIGDLRIWHAQDADMFGERECIHSVKARLAKAVGQTEILKETLIPKVSIETRGTSSWKNWYLATEA